MKSLSAIGKIYWNEITDVILFFCDDLHKNKITSIQMRIPFVMTGGVYGDKSDIIAKRMVVAINNRLNREGLNIWGNNVHINFSSPHFPQHLSDRIEAYYDIYLPTDEQSSQFHQWALKKRLNIKHKV